MTTRVVIINDQIAMRVGLEAMLAQLDDCEVLGSFASTSSITELMIRYQPDLLLLDMQVLASVYQLASEAKACLPHLKIILTSHAPVSEHRLDVERIGAQGLVCNFDSQENLTATISSVIKGEKLYSQHDEVVEFLDSFRRKRNSQTGHPLSPREVDVLCCVAQAMTAKQIAKDLQISVKTVDRHKANIMSKLSMRSQIELTRYAIRNGFVDA